MANEPRYLTDPGSALSERQRWEDSLHAAILRECLAQQSLVAAGFPGWRTVVDRVVAVVGLPLNLVRRLLDAEPDADEEARAVADRLAPTIATAAYNEHILELMAANGWYEKRWVTRRDDRVRETHSAADGQTAQLSRPFVVGGFMLQYPADSSTAPIGEWINCRCVVVAVR